MDVRTLDGVTLRPLIACADDLGADAHNDACIRQLLEARRLSGASVLVDGSNAAEAASVPRDVRLGLHLNLTEAFGQPFAVRPVARWIVDAWRGHVAGDATLRAQLRSEIDRQIERFAQLAGRLPDYVDGHEHVHGLPGIAELLAERLATAGAAGIPVRSVRSQRWRGAKAEVISRLCGQHAGTPTLNDDFVGVYLLDSAGDYAKRMALWLASAQGRALLMCHPGSGAGTLAHGPARAAEHAFFSGPHWPALLSATRWALVPATAAPAPT